MPMMKMNRNYRVATKTGHIIRFKKGEETPVPNNGVVIEECQKFVAEFCDSTEAQDREDLVERIAKSVPTPKEKEEAIKGLMQKMLDNQEAYREHFTAANRPSQKYISSKLDINITAQEVTDAWNELTKPQSDEG